METSTPNYLNRWDLSNAEERFNIDTDVVMDTCDWKNRKSSIFSDFLKEIEKEETND
jgi:hypothetical protein